MSIQTKEEPYWVKPGAVPPSTNPNAAVEISAENQDHLTFSNNVANGNASAPSAEIPMAQPYNYNSSQAQATYNIQPRYVNGMDPGYNQHSTYAAQPVYPSNTPYNTGVQYVTATEQYCGPISCAIGLVICFFTGWGCLVACCPCDTRTVTYANGNRMG